VSADNAGRWVRVHVDGELVDERWADSSGGICMVDEAHGPAEYAWTLEAAPDPPVLLCAACTAVLRRGVAEGAVDPPTQIRRIQQEAES
jgi:hypothetical protein